MTVAVAVAFAEATMMTRTEQFDLAVRMIRKGESSLAIEAALEADGPGDVRAVIAEAGKYARETQEAAFACAVEAFKQGRTFFDVCKALEKCDFHPYDSQVVAGRAQAQAEKEMAEKSL